ncbi:hypothetical protein AYI68_g4144, partial [Smittium mucronatum]
GIQFELNVYNGVPSAYFGETIGLGSYAFAQDGKYLINIVGDDSGMKLYINNNFISFISKDTGDYQGYFINGPKFLYIGGSKVGQVISNIKIACTYGDSACSFYTPYESTYTTDSSYNSNYFITTTDGSSNYDTSEYYTTEEPSYIPASSSGNNNYYTSTQRTIPGTSNNYDTSEYYTTAEPSYNTASPSGNSNYYGSSQQTNPGSTSNYDSSEYYSTAELSSNPASSSGNSNYYGSTQEITSSVSSFNGYSQYDSSFYETYQTDTEISETDSCYPTNNGNKSVYSPNGQVNYGKDPIVISCCTPDFRLFLDSNSQSDMSIAFATSGGLTASLGTIEVMSGIASGRTSIRRGSYNSQNIPLFKRQDV